jgi:hypothetical protein
MENEEDNNLGLQELEETIENDELKNTSGDTPNSFIQSQAEFKAEAEALADEKEFDRNPPTPIGLNTYTYDRDKNKSVPTVTILKDNNIELDNVYFPGDESQPFEGLNTNGIKKLQKKLETAGFLNRDNYIPGVLAGGTLNAMYKLMGESNELNTAWDTLLDNIVLAPLYDPSDLPKFEEPDFVTLTNDVIRVVKREIGRTPTQSEINILTGILGNLKETEFKEGIDALTDTLQPGYAKKEVMFEGRMVPTSEVVEVDVPSQPREVASAEDVFATKVRDLFKPEMDLNQRREQTKNVANIIKSSIAGLRSIGG